MNVFELMAKISLDTSQYDKGLDDSKSKVESFGSKFASGMKSALKVGTVVMGAAATAVGAMTKSAVSGFAEQEQLIGGVQKLYGNMGMSVEEYAKSTGKSVNEVKGEWSKLEKAQNTVLHNAENAYKTSGMSMNEYMDTATSFSAALINSLGGDTQKAAEQTDVAMRAISDNFNTFGGDIGMIQGAFQGFAKQNYTMLDNLKLGYGGTKQEMERLVEDANKYAAANGKAANLSVDSFSDIVTAIDLIQQKQGIAGTTAREAASTVTGSLGMLKSAWDNLVSGLGDKDADMGALIGNVVDSAKTAFGNLLPVVGTALTGIGELIANIAPVLADQLPTLIENVIPSLIASAGKLVSALGKGIIQALPLIISSGLKIAQTLLNGLLKAIPQMATGASEIITQLANGLSEALPVLIQALPDIIKALTDGLVSLFDSMPEITNMLGELIGVVADTLIDLIPVLVEAAMTITEKMIGALTEPETLFKLVEMAGRLIIAVAGGLLAAVPKLLEGVAKIMSTVVTNITSFDFGKAGSELIGNITSALQGAADKLTTWWDGWSQEIGKYAKIGWDSVVKTWSAVGQWFLDRWEDIKKPFVKAAQWFGDVFTNAWDGIKTAFSAVGGFFGQVWNGIKGAFSNVAGWFSDIFTKAWDGIKNVFAPVGQTFQNIGDSILNGLKSIVNTLITGINNVITVPFDGLNSALRSIRDIDIVGNKPFSWLSDIPIPQIPYLAKGGVLKKGQTAFLEGQGDEAVIPLSQNTEWIDKVAKKLSERKVSPTYNISIAIDKMGHTDEAEARKLADYIMQVIAEQTSREGAVYA